MSGFKPEMWKRIVAYEEGGLGRCETIQLFLELIKNGMAWTLQDHYGRTSVYLIENGFLSKLGDILKEETD
jgi:hypothetical protein